MKGEGDYLIKRTLGRKKREGNYLIFGLEKDVTPQERELPEEGITGNGNCFIGDVLERQFLFKEGEYSCTPRDYIRQLPLKEGEYSCTSRDYIVSKIRGVDNGAPNSSDLIWFIKELRDLGQERKGF